jgi:N-acetylglutamate synthase-like GNAT family acetyltransferase
MVTVITPETSQEWEKYFEIRYSTLREEWGQPIGSEHLVDDHSSYHALAFDDEGKPVGVCRMHFNSPEETQIRMMGVMPGTRTKGVGSALLQYFEKRAKHEGAKKMVLDARDYAVKFYEKNGYTLVKQTHILWGLIPHFWMEKTL